MLCVDEDVVESGDDGDLVVVVTLYPNVEEVLVEGVTVETIADEDALDVEECCDGTSVEVGMGI